MTDQEKASEYLTKMAEALKLKGENVFKIRAFEKASPIVSETPDLRERALAGTLTQINGIGKGIAEILTDFLLNNSHAPLDEIYKSLPAGLIELTAVPGLGPKKAIQVIEELDIHTLRELEYACTENRLLHLKGFGEKNQAKILEGVRFLLQAAGQARFADQEELANTLIQLLRTKIPSTRIEWTGPFRRKLEVLQQLDLLVEDEKNHRTLIDREIENFRKKNPQILDVKLHDVTSSEFESEWFKTTAASDFLNALDSKTNSSAELVKIDPVFMETADAAKMFTSIQGQKQWDLLCHSVDEIQGIFHSHTTASDGSASLEQMVGRALELGYRYIGITEHSESAFYAHGLKKEDLKSQRKEIDLIQKKFPDIRIYWGIESDILQDGSLDYTTKILDEFDFVIASVHSRFSMNEGEMTARLLRAIENPATTMIGHLTGRILLGRPGYALNFSEVFKAASEYDVVIEINAHPARLDVDWRHGRELRERQVKVSVNPDAHDLKGLADTRFGLAVAQKALLPKAQILNTWDTARIDHWFSNRRSGR